ncbi:MAG: TIGR00180 family glycosyltransferase [Candidatus Omnitrophica bacterium]|nr:TIGR00180 family glycosyltransferase [Candidatus Omnitrophota bacterium]
MSEETARLTILIPTLNRPEFLLRGLRYLQWRGFRGVVMIGDSSSEPHVERVDRGIRAIAPGFRVEHALFPGKRHFECLRVMAHQVSTPYATYVCDDDLLVPSALEEGIRFLDRHPDYSAALGVGVLLDLERDGAFGPLAGSSVFSLRGFEQERAAERLLDLLMDYTVVPFSVNRTEQFKRQWVWTEDFRDPPFAIEIFPSSLIVTQGKVKQLNRLFVARHLHSRRYPMMKAFDWLTGEHWLSSYRFYQDRLAEELCAQDGLTLSEAQDLVKRGFWKHLARQLRFKWLGLTAPPPPAWALRWRGRMRSLVPVRGFGRQLRRFLPAPRHRFSLAALRHPSSPYHADFQEIEEGITTPLEEALEAG